MYNEYKGDMRKMDWTARLNKVMDYVEENIHGEIAEEEISRITACPYTMFQSSFSQIVGDSLFRICEKKASDHGSL